MKTQGFGSTRPCIKKIDFVRKGMFSIYFVDGRIIMVPLSAFPAIKKLTRKQREKWYTLDDVGFSFDECDEVFHIEQVLGSYVSYQYAFVPSSPKKCAEPGSQRLGFHPVPKSKKRLILNSVER